VAAPTPFWENFLRDQTHPADCPSFYTLLLFVRVFAGLAYGGPDCPGCRTAFFYLWLLFTIGVELVLLALVRSDAADSFPAFYTRRIDLKHFPARIFRNGVK